jgi:dolichol-phosphate mannosyltransferase
MDSNIAVVIPAYQAEKHIRHVLEGIPDFVTGVVVVDDCSPDNTVEVVQECMQRDGRIRLVQHSQNQGVGGATLSGYRAAVEMGATVIAKMDSDNQMDPRYLLPLVNPILHGKADYTKGNRFLVGKEIEHMPVLRRAGNLGLSFLSKAASGYWNIFDPTNGYTALRAALFERLDLDKIDRRYFFETSLLIELGIRRAVVRDVSIPARYGDETSFLSEWKALVEFPPKLVGGMLRRILTLHFLHDFTSIAIFLLAGFFGVAFGLGWGIYHWVKSSQMGVPASTGTVMIAVLPLTIGLQLILQAIVLDIQNVPGEVLDADG